MNDFKFIRRHLRLTIRAAGDLVGVTDRTWANWEKGATSPSLIHEESVKKLLAEAKKKAQEAA